MNNNVIAVWGNNGSGKSLISCALAAELSKDKKSVIIISTDKQAPMFRSFLPHQEDRPEFSLGQLMTTPITLTALRNKIHIHPDCEYLGFMTLVSSDNGFIYQSHWKNETLFQLVELLQEQQLADYIIFDCAPDVFSSHSTLFALEHAGAVVRVYSPDNRSLSFFESQYPVLRGSSYRYDQHITVLNNTHDYCPASRMTEDWGIAFVLPHAPAAYSAFLGGKLICKLDGYEGYRFSQVINDITAKVVYNIGE